MRLQSYYMPDEIIENLYTAGGEFETEDKVEYRGLYHRYITNEAYTGSTWNSKTSKKLVPLIQRITRDKTYETIKATLKTKYQTVKSAIPVITNDNRAAGKFNSYFFKKVNELVFIESNELQFNNWVSRNIDPNAFNAVKIEWTISGERLDTKRGPILIKGVISKNNDQITYAESVLPGIRVILNDPLQYYIDNTFIIPVDING